MMPLNESVISTALLPKSPPISIPWPAFPGMSPSVLVWAASFPLTYNSILSLWITPAR